jgi:hypothetical protein
MHDRPLPGAPRAFLALLPLSLCLGFLLLAAPRPGSAQNASGAKRLLIVAPARFAAPLQDFIAHKKHSRPADFQSLEDILAQTAGADDPEKLKRFLYRQWKTQGLGYVLLVGDVDLMPVRFMVLDRVTPAAFDYAFYPSDLYYADLARQDGSFDDWNAQKQGFHAAYFGEVRGEKNKQDPINYDQIHYLPEIAVGRWPVSTPDEVRRLAAKTISYELRLAASNCPSPRAAFIAVGGWVDSRGLLTQLAASLTNTWQIEKRFYGTATAPDHAQVRSLFDLGVDLVAHAGHGTADSWEQCFSVLDLKALTNSVRLPIVISAGCSTAYFAPLPPYGPYVDVEGKHHAGSDHNEVFSAPPPPPHPYQTGPCNPTGLGEQLLKADQAGAVAYIGCNTGSQPCALTLLEGFMTAVAASPRSCLGDHWNQATRHYFQKERLAELKPTPDWYPASIFFQGMKFMLFGDPTIPIAAAR